MKNTENPICSEEVLKAKVDLLIEIRDLSLSMNITPILGGSTVLGIMRDGDILPWGTGVALNFKSEELDPLINEIKKTLTKRGYKVRLYNKEYSKKLKVFTNRKNVLAELMSWYSYEEYRVRHKSKLPAYLFKEFSDIYLRKEKFITFHPVDDYLQFRFGDWKTPINSFNREDYHESNFSWNGLNEIKKGLG